MKTKSTRIRTSEADEKMLKQAGAKLEAETGRKPMKSRVILTALEKYANDNPVCYYSNDTAISETKKNIEFGKVAIQKFYDQYFEVTEMRLTFDELQTVLAGVGKMHGIAILTEAIESMTLRKKYAEYCETNPAFSFPMESMNKINVSGLIDLAAGFYCPDVQYRFVGLQWQCYGLEDSFIFVIPEQVEKLFTQYRSYATSPIEHEKLAVVQELCSVLNKFLKYSDVSEPRNFNIPFVAEFNPFTDTYQPHEQFIKYTLNRRILIF